MPVAVVARLAHGLRGPAQAALLVALAAGGGAAVRVGGILAIGIVETALGAPDDIRGQRRRRVAARRVERGLMQRERAGRLEEPERALDLPDQVGRLARGHGETGDRKA